MKNLWKVTFDAKYSGLGDMMEESVKVVANGDGMKAVNKARRAVIGKEIDDNVAGVGWVTRRCRYVKLIGLELLHSIDV
jgi:hypothetical protein